MMIKEALLLFTALVLGALHETDGSKLVCYAELWAGERPSPANYDLENNLPDETCDYLILVYLTLDPNTWGLKMYTGYGAVNQDVLRGASKYRENSPGMKVLVSVGGWEDGVAKYSEMISEPSRRSAFIRSVIETLETYDLDGVELHWLYPGAVWRGGKAGDRENFLQLVKELQTAFKKRQWIVTASVPPDQASLDAGYNVQGLNRYLHQMHVRTMDMRGDWDGVTSGHCPLYSSPWEKPELRQKNMNDSLELWLRRGASPRKLLATIPYLGRSFTLKDQSQNSPGSPTIGGGRASPFIQARGIMAYFEICDDVQAGRLTEGFQEGAEQPYAFRDDLWVGYENADSIQKKVKLVQDKKVSGVAVFALGLDDFTGKCGQSHYLLRKTREFLGDNRVHFPDPRIKDK